MRRKTKHEISDNSSQEKETAKNTSTKSIRNGSKISKQIKADVSEDDAILRNIGMNNSEKKSSLDSSANRESSDTTSKENSIATYSTFSMEDLTSDDEVYTFYCPGNFNKQNMCKKTIESLGSVLDSNKNGNVQVEILESEKKFITVALPTNEKGGCLVNLPYKGHVIIQKSLEIFNEKNFNKPDKNYNVTFPDNLKARHPLLGVEWESHLGLVKKAISNNKLFQKKFKKLEKEKSKIINKTESSKMNTSVDSPNKKRKRS